jgi:hypothetical protein
VNFGIELQLSGQTGSCAFGMPLKGSAAVFLDDGVLGGALEALGFPALQAFRAKARDGNLIGGGRCCDHADAENRDGE